MKKECDFDDIDEQVADFQFRVPDESVDGRH